MLSAVLSFIWIALPLLVWIAKLCARKRIHPALLYFVTGLAGYLVLLTSVWALESQLRAKMNRFDLDRSGSFSESELTPEAQLAIDDWANDTGRSFAPIIGIPITAIWYAILFAVVLGGEWIFRLAFKRKGDVLAAETTQGGNIEAIKSENPYQPPTVG